MFDDSEYSTYLQQLHQKYGRRLEDLCGFSGLPAYDNQVEELMEQFTDFDYADISKTLGAQKRRPPESDYDFNEKVYEQFGTLPEALGKNFDERLAGEIQSRMDGAIKELDSNSGGYRSEGLNSLRFARKLILWFEEKFGFIDSKRLPELRLQIAQEFDTRWAQISAGVVHDKHLGEIRFSSSRSLPPGDGEWPETLNPAKDPIYAHAFLSRTLRDAAGSGMYFLMCPANSFRFKLADFANPDSAYQCFPLLPGESDARNPELIRFIGKQIEGAGESLEIKVTPATSVDAIGHLKIKMSKADAGKLTARVEALAMIAEANRTAEAQLPDIFSTAQKWPYKDKVLAPEKVKAAIETAWEYNWKKPIKITHMRVNHYRPGHEWDQEFNPLKQPIARLTFSYIGLVFEQEGRTFCVEDGIQLRQFYMLGEGYGEDLNVLFWGVNPFALPDSEIKRIAK